MVSEKIIILQRDCEALLIPTAVPILLPEGSTVSIVQQLGGTFTVNINGNLARIDGKDADALGLSNLPETIEHAVELAQGPVEIDAVWAALRTCYDPEIPINIVELGLIYACEAIPIDVQHNQIKIKMTLTAPGCGMGPVLAGDVEKKVRQVKNVTDVLIELVFDPPWNMSMMSQAAKLELGML